MTELSLQ